MSHAFDPKQHRVTIDSHTHKPSTQTSSIIDDNRVKFSDPNHSTESICGIEERMDAVCSASSYPDEYERSTPVVMLINNRGDECTAWRVGDDNRLFTAQHCLSTQADLSGAEIWFNYEADDCGVAETSYIVKVSGGSLLASDWELDYSLFTVNDFSSIKRFGNLGLDVRSGDVGENIFIPQHGKGDPRQISIESDMNDSGYCEIDDNDANGYGSGTDIEYYCDTTNSSSGAPVISGITGRVLALHHLGGCENSGSKISLIWKEVADHFNNQVPEGDGGSIWAPANEVPEASFVAECDELSCRFDATGSTDSDGEIEDFDWEFGDGAKSSGMTVEHEFYDGGDYQVSLAVEDDEGAVGSYTESVSVKLDNEAPSASFSTACVDNACTFNAGNSSDPDGNIERWDWNLGDGSHSSGEEISHEFSEAGTYRVHLEVEDDKGSVDTRSRNVTVALPNQAPEAAFTYECNEGNCSFDATGSTDEDGTISEYQWSMDDGTNKSGVHTEHVYTTGGSYDVTLAVKDDGGKQSLTTRTVTVELPNAAPSASFNIDCDDLECRFDASSSSDSDGSISSFSWNLGDGSTSTGKTLSHIYSNAGQFTVTLTVEDNEGAVDAQSRQVTASLPNAAPLASFTYECAEDLCTFDASGSSDSDGAIESFRWTMGDGRSATGQQVDFRYREDGRFTVTLEVEDDGGKIDITSRTLQVDVPNAAPVAEFQVACDDRRCTLDAGKSRDPDGQVDQFAWSLGDGTTHDGERLVHEYTQDGRYTISLTVTDDAGARHTVSETIDVELQRVIDLSVNGKVHDGQALAYLKWQGAEGENIRIFRNGGLLTSAGNDGRFYDSELDGFAKSASYQVCEVYSDLCSDTIHILIQD